MSKPRLLDLFCGAGGAAMGYHRAGFDVVGVDIKPQPHYPFEFHQGDALTWPLDGFDVIHASPPCQAYTIVNKSHKLDHPDLIGAVRERLAGRSLAVIENVRHAPLPSAVTLCGSTFGLRVWRHRYFEIRPFMLTPQCIHEAQPLNPYNTKSRHRDGIEKQSMHHYGDAMGVTDWMVTEAEITEAIPPAYTEWVGSRLLSYLQNGTTKDVLHGARV